MERHKYNLFGKFHMDEKNIFYDYYDNKAFSMNQYKIINNPAHKQFVKCEKIQQNGKIKLFYFIAGYRRLEQYFQILDREKSIELMESLLQFISEVKENEFMNIQNMALEPDKVFVDETTGSIRLIYIPIQSQENYEFDLVQELKVLLMYMVDKSEGLKREYDKFEKLFEDEENSIQSMLCALHKEKSKGRQKEKNALDEILVGVQQDILQASGKTEDTSENIMAYFQQEQEPKKIINIKKIAAVSIFGVVLLLGVLWYIQGNKEGESRIEDNSLMLTSIPKSTEPPASTQIPEATKISTPTETPVPTETPMPTETPVPTREKEEVKEFVPTQSPVPESNVQTNVPPVVPQQTSPNISTDTSGNSDSENTPIDDAEDLSDCIIVE